MGRFSDLVATKVKISAEAEKKPPRQEIPIARPPSPRRPPSYRKPGRQEDEEGEALAAEREEPFLVDNAELQSRSKGIKYRRSPNLQDRAKRTLRWPDLDLSGNRAAEAASITEGAKLVVREDAALFMTVDSSTIIRVLSAGQVVEAAGPPRISAGYAMLPTTEGAVQLRLLELEAEYFKRRPGLAQFGTIVRGVRIHEDWIRVKQYYLPTQVGGRQVLTPAWWEDLQDREQKEKERQKIMSMASWIDKKIEDDEKADLVQKWGDLTAFDTSSLTPGSGTLYEVVSQRAIIRAEPDQKAKMENFKNKGDAVELFEWDRTWRWRRCLDVHVLSAAAAEQKKAVRIAGWMLVDHPEVGPLLRPLGFPETAAWSKIQLTPVIAAVWENNTLLLRHLIKDHEQFKQSVRGDPSLLSLAIARGHLDSVVILFEAGLKRSDEAVTESFPAVLASTENSDLPKLAAVLEEALSGKTVNCPDLDRAVEMLLPETQGIAERLLELLPESQPEQEETLKDKELQETFKEEELQNTVKEEETEIYEVVYSAVWVRADPLGDAAKLTVRKRGERVRLYDWDATGNWRRIKTGGVGSCAEMRERIGEGWMMLNHPTLGNLLQRVDAVD